MFVHVSPDEESYGETVSTLTFAKRVASVELGASSRNAESAELRESKEKVRAARAHAHCSPVVQIICLRPGLKRNLLSCFVGNGLIFVSFWLHKDVRCSRN